jgi:hypothetical protein
MTDPTWKRAVDKTLGREAPRAMPMSPWRNAWRTGSFLTVMFVGYLIGYALMAAFYPR